ncbi:DNA recombination protein RmuC [Rhodobium gokarnense]|uniref:DNA recombination protein RmuC n=1 Tax=Rhodobium gokarnense TaxID=364296 RepID=UPI00387311FD
MNETLLLIGDRAVSTGEAVFAAALLFFLILLVMTVALWRNARARAEAEAAAAERGHEMEARIADLLRTQSEMTGRMQTMAEVFGSRQSDLTRALAERLDGLGHRLGQSMSQTSKDTQSNLSQLNERLALIDRAQKSIQDLTGQVSGLQQVLANKQTRGAFGQGRMEAIISDGLPAGSYTLQATLSSGTRPDCLIHMPNEAPGLVVDAKFPLEGFTRFREAETPEQAQQAAQQVRRDISKHVQDISERYFIPGETQDTAFLFVPSEAIFADLHEHFDDLVQKAHRARVVIVSPALLVLSIQIVQTVLRDVRMREEALVIQREVAHLADDTNRLRDRVLKLQNHFGQATRDVEQILISSDKIIKRGSKIEALDFDDVHRDTEPGRDGGTGRDDAAAARNAAE